MSTGSHFSISIYQYLHVWHNEDAIAETADLSPVQAHLSFKIGVSVPLLVTTLTYRDFMIPREALVLPQLCPTT